MKSSHVTVTETTLILSDQEKGWLRGVMQNPFQSNETPDNKKYREALWHALSVQLSNDTNA